MRITMPEADESMNNTSEGNMRNQDINQQSMNQATNTATEPLQNQYQQYQQQEQKREDQPSSYDVRSARFRNYNQDDNYNTTYHSRNSENTTEKRNSRGRSQTNYVEHSYNEQTQDYNSQHSNRADGSNRQDTYVQNTPRNMSATQDAYYDVDAERKQYYNDYYSQHNNKYNSQYNQQGPNSRYNNQYNQYNQYNQSQNQFQRGNRYNSQYQYNNRYNQGYRQNRFNQGFGRVGTQIRSGGRMVFGRVKNGIRTGYNRVHSWINIDSKSKVGKILIIVAIAICLLLGIVALFGGLHAPEIKDVVTFDNFVIFVVIVSVIIIMIKFNKQ